MEKQKIDYFKVLSLASAAYREGYDTATPTPLTVVQHKDMLDDTSPIVYREVVNDGLFGFGHIQIFYKTNAAFVNFFKKNGVETNGDLVIGNWCLSYSSYHKYRWLSIDNDGSSYERLTAGYNNACHVLRYNGIDCTSVVTLD